MTERDTDIDELATGKTLVDMPAIPQSIPPRERLTPIDAVHVTTLEEDEKAGIRIPRAVEAMPLPSHVLEPLFRSLELANANGAAIAHLSGLVEDALRELKNQRREQVYLEDQIIAISSVLTSMLIKGETVPGSLVGMTVLINEDSDLLRRSLARAFERCGAAVLQAHSAESAQEQIEKAAASGTQIDAAVVDVRLTEGGSGVKVARLLNATMRRCQIVFLTGGSIEHLQQVAIDLRASLLRKPCELLAMVEAVKARAAE